MNEIIQALLDGGAFGIVAAIFLGCSGYLFRALRAEQAARLADAKEHLTRTLEIQKQVSDQIDRLADLTSRQIRNQ